MVALTQRQGLNSMDIPLLAEGHEKTVQGVYDIINIMQKKSGILELTEGRYEDNPNRDYYYAQGLQQKHLLTLAEIKPGDKLLDIGCGMGVLLREAKHQDIKGCGITLSKKQLESHTDIETYLLNWRHIIKNKPEWENNFDSICAIGSLEHFVSPKETDQKTEIYNSFFETCRWLLKPGGHLVVTAIHYRPEYILDQENAYNQINKPWLWFRGAQFHLGILAWLGGAYYPTIGDLPPIAKNKGFKLIEEEDGTKDYYHTSEFWLKNMIQKSLTTNMQKTILGQFNKYPLHTTYGMMSLMLFKNWNWQFRADKKGKAPTKLIRYSWKLN